MGWGAARKLQQVIANTVNVLAVEIMCAVQAIEHRAPLQAAESSRLACAAVREVVPPLGDDRPIGPDIESIARLILDGELNALVR